MVKYIVEIFTIVEIVVDDLFDFYKNATTMIERYIQFISATD
jgi:hypothetical protein